MKYYDTLTNEQKSRWISLLLAIDQIDEYCDQSHIAFNSDLLKPIAIKHFIQDKSRHVQQELDRIDKTKKVMNSVYNFKPSTSSGVLENA
jgi:hypothetical protein